MESKEFIFIPAPEVCTEKIRLVMNGNVIEDAVFFGGCPGNQAGIRQLVKGMNAEKVISLLEGIRCGRKKTSCPDQLAKALKEYLNLKLDGTAKSADERF